MTPEEREHYEALYSATYEKYLQMPKEYFPHDSDAHRDPAIRKLVRKHGKEAYANWWLLIELLTERKGHVYDISDDDGMADLVDDMGRLGEMSEEEVLKFVSNLGDLGLLDAEMLGEGKVASGRVARNVCVSAEAAANRAAGGALGGRPRKTA